MSNHAFRIHFASIDDAISQFDNFFAWADSLGFALNFSRKRDGASHVVLLRECPSSDAGEFLKWCRTQPRVTLVVPITEADFWSAPSHSV